MTAETVKLVLTALPPTVAAICAVIIAVVNHRRLGELHVSINSRLTELLESTKQAAHAAGRQEEIDIQRANGKPY